MRSWTLLVVLSAMMLFVAACSSASDDATDDAPSDDAVAEEVEPTATPEPEPTETPEPTPTPEPEPTATPEPEPTETPEPEVATEDEDEDSDDPRSGSGQDEASELDGVLLSLEDLPAGWIQVDDEFEDFDEFSDISDEPFDAPCGIEDPGDEYDFDTVGEAERTFEGGELGPFLSQNLIQFENSDEAAEVMDLFRMWFDCDEWTEVDDFGEEMIFSIDDLPFEEAGDDMLALSIGLEFGNLSDEEAAMMALFGDISIEFVFVQRDVYLTMMMYIDMFGVSDADFESLVQLADEKMANAN